MNEFINDKMIGKGNSPNLGGGDGFPHMCVNRYEHAYCQVVIGCYFLWIVIFHVFISIALLSLCFS